MIPTVSLLLILFCWGLCHVRCHNSPDSIAAKLLPLPYGKTACYLLGLRLSIVCPTTSRREQRGPRCRALKSSPANPYGVHGTDAGISWYPLPRREDSPPLLQIANLGATCANRGHFIYSPQQRRDQGNELDSISVITGMSLHPK